jgi:hypothetical protein
VPSPSCSAATGSLRFLLQKYIPAATATNAATPPSTPPTIGPAETVVEDATDGEDVGELVVVELTRSDDNGADKGADNGADEGADEEDSADVGGLVIFPLNVSRNNTVVVVKFRGSFWPTYVVYAPCPMLPCTPAHM